MRPLESYYIFTTSEIDKVATWISFTRERKSFRFYLSIFSSPLKRSQIISWQAQFHCFTLEELIFSRFSLHSRIFIFANQSRIVNLRGNLPISSLLIGVALVLALKNASNVFIFLIDIVILLQPQLLILVVTLEFLILLKALVLNVSMKIIYIFLVTFFVKVILGELLGSIILQFLWQLIFFLLAPLLLINFFFLLLLLLLRTDCSSLLFSCKFLCFCS